MARQLFGTDGIRGRANRPPITAETALAVARAAGRVFHRGEHRNVVVIGKDTRLSGYLLEPALTAGFIAVGMDVGRENASFFTRFQHNRTRTIAK